MDVGGSRLVPEQRKERHPEPRIRQVHIADGRARGGEAGVLVIADHDAGLDVVRLHAIDDHFRAADVDVVVRGDDGHTRLLEAHLDWMRGARGHRAKTEQHRPVRDDANLRLAGLQVWHHIFGNLLRDLDRARRVRVERGDVSRGERGQIRRFAVLIEKDVHRSDLSAWSRHRHFDGRHGSSELFRFGDGDGGTGEPAGVPERDAAADEDKEQQNE